MQVFDKRDEELPKAGLLQVFDAETGDKVWLNTNDTFTRLQYRQQFQRIIADAVHIFRGAGASLIQVATGDDYVKKLQEFFIKRS